MIFSQVLYRPGHPAKRLDCSCFWGIRSDTFTYHSASVVWQASGFPLLWAAASSIPAWSRCLPPGWAGD